MPGRPRKPTALKRQQGTLQPCRTNFDEPQLDSELPEPPEGLSEPVLVQYYVHGERLLKLGVVNAAHAGALAGMAQAYVDWRTACRLLDEHGSPIVEETLLGDGEGSLITRIKPHPAVAIRNEADRRYRAWCQSFGLTPADQAKVKAAPKKEKSKLAQLIEMSA